MTRSTERTVSLPKTATATSPRPSPTASIKGIGDGPDPGHHEPAEHNPYTLPPPKTVEGKSEDDDDGIHQLDLNKVITAEFDDAQWPIEPVIPAHRSTALYAAGKTGKSLLMLDFDQARLL